MLLKIVKILVGVIVAFVVLLAAIFLRPDLSREELQPYAFSYLELPSGATAHYQAMGDPDQPVIILIHGQTSSLYDWQFWMPLLAERYRVIRLDMPGHGLTGLIPGDQYTLQSMVAFTKEFLDTLGIDQAVVVGNSMGGDVAVLFALEHPETVTALVPIASGGILPDYGEGAEGGSDIVALGHLKLLLRYFAYPLFEPARGLIPNPMVVDQSLINDELDYASSIISRHTGNRWAMFKDHEALFSLDLSGRLQDISVPTLVMYGMQDPLVPEVTIKKLAAAIPGSELITYDNSAHGPMLQPAQESADDLFDFLERRVPKLAGNRQLSVDDN